MKEIAKEPWNYKFSEHGPDHFELTVVCGGVGVYEFTMRLNAAQLASYQKEGLPYIIRLVEQVRADQSPFQAQRVG